VPTSAATAHKSVRATPDMNTIGPAWLNLRRFAGVSAAGARSRNPEQGRGISEPRAAILSEAAESKDLCPLILLSDKGGELHEFGVANVGI
jgi:hypothetical protein